MTRVKRLHDEVRRLTAMLEDFTAKEADARTHADEISQRIGDLIIRAQQGEDVSKELVQAKRDRSDTLHDEQDHRRAAAKLKEQLEQTKGALRAAEKEAAATRYMELAMKRKEADTRIEALTGDLVKAIRDLYELDAAQQLEARAAGIITGRAAKRMIEDYLVYRLKPVLGTLLPRVTVRCDLAELDSMAREVSAANG